MNPQVQDILGALLLTLGCVFCCFIVEVGTNPGRCFLNKTKMSDHG
jgi:hypothetical protein